MANIHIHNYNTNTLTKQCIFIHLMVFNLYNNHVNHVAWHFNPCLHIRPVRVRVRKRPIQCHIANKHLSDGSIPFILILSQQFCSCCFSLSKYFFCLLYQHNSKQGELLKLSPLLLYSIDMIGSKNCAGS